VAICALVGALLISAVDLHGADQSSAGDVYADAMARADKAGTLILFVYSKDIGDNLSDNAKRVLLAQGRRSVTARMVVQYVPIDPSDQRYARYRSRIKGEAYPFWVLAKPNGEFLAGGDYDTVGADGSAGWRTTVARFRKQFPTIGPKEREQIAEMLVQAQADLGAERLGDVKASLADLQGVWHPADMVRQCAELREAYDESLADLTKRPQRLLNEGKRVEAALAYQWVIDAFDTRGDEASAARQAQQKLLGEHPEIRAPFTEQLGQQRALAARLAKLLEQAAQLATQGKHVEAALTYQQVIDTPGVRDSQANAARQSQQKLLTERYEIRARFTKQLRQQRDHAAAEAAGQEPAETQPTDTDATETADAGTPTTAPAETPDLALLERRAASLVKMAQQYHQRDMIEKAKAKLAECVEKYPDTEAAQQARKLLRQW